MARSSEAFLHPSSRYHNDSLVICHKIRMSKALLRKL